MFENAINFRAYFVIFLRSYYCKFFSMDLMIATYVAGLGNDIKRKSIWQFLKANKFDIIFLQETHSSTNKLKLWKMEWGGKIIWSTAQ